MGTVTGVISIVAVAFGYLLSQSGGRVSLREEFLKAFNKKAKNEGVLSRLTSRFLQNMPSIEIFQKELIARTFQGTLITHLFRDGIAAKYDFLKKEIMGKRIDFKNRLTFDLKEMEMEVEVD